MPHALCPSFADPDECRVRVRRLPDGRLLWTCPRALGCRLGHGDLA